MLTKTLMRAASAARPAPTAAIRSMVAIRATSTQTTTTSAEAYSLLVAQRKLRPIAPHLTIYQPQLTWVMSGLNRITGLLIAAPVYLFGMTYAVAPTLGVAMDSASIAASFAALPVAAKVAVKLTAATPFVYHSLNGMRHLVWDSARFMHIPGVYKTGYVVVGLTAAATGYLAFGI